MVSYTKARRLATHPYTNHRFNGRFYGAIFRRTVRCLGNNIVIYNCDIFHPLRKRS